MLLHSVVLFCTVPNAGILLSDHTKYRWVDFFVIRLSNTIFFQQKFDRIFKGNSICLCFFLCDIIDHSSMQSPRPKIIPRMWTEKRLHSKPLWGISNHWSLLFLCSTGEKLIWCNAEAFICQWHEITVSNYSFSRSDRHTKYPSIMNTIRYMWKKKNESVVVVNTNFVWNESMSISPYIRSEWMCLCAVRIVSLWLRMQSLYILRKQVLIEIMETS